LKERKEVFTSYNVNGAGISVQGQSVFLKVPGKEVSGKLIPADSGKLNFQLSGSWGESKEDRKIDAKLPLWYLKEANGTDKLQWATWGDKKQMEWTLSPNHLRFFKPVNELKLTPMPPLTRCQPVRL